MPPLHRRPGPRSAPRQGDQDKGGDRAGCSADLSPLYFFLWGYLKARVCTDKPRTSEQLKRAIITEVGRTPTEMVDRPVGRLQTVRLPLVISRSGAHFKHLLREADMNELPSAIVNIMHRSVCHSI